MEYNTLPLGLGMALSRNKDAMSRFAAMSESEKQSVIEQTHRVRSRQDMQRLVDSLTRAPEDGE